MKRLRSACSSSFILPAFILPAFILPALPPSRPCDIRAPMRCPFCGNLEDRVVDSREGREGDVIRRRRECARCERRFTSYEKIELPTFQVVKRDQRRET